MEQSTQYQTPRSPAQRARQDLSLVDLTVLNGGLTVIELNDAAKLRTNSGGVARLLLSIRDALALGTPVLIDLKGFKDLNDDWREAFLALIVKAGPQVGVTLSNPGPGIAQKLTGFGSLFRVYSSAGEAYQALGADQAQVDSNGTQRLTQTVLANLEQKHSTSLAQVKLPSPQAIWAEHADPQLEIASSHEKTTVRVVSAHLPDNIVSLKFAKLLSEIMNSDTQLVVVDLAAVKSIGAYAVGSLVAAYKTGKPLVVVNVAPPIFQIFTVSRLSSILDIRKNEN